MGEASGLTGQRAAGAGPLEAMLRVNVHCNYTVEVEQGVPEGGEPEGPPLHGGEEAGAGAGARAPAGLPGLPGPAPQSGRLDWEEYFQDQGRRGESCALEAEVAEDDELGSFAALDDDDGYDSQGAETVPTDDEDLDYLWEEGEGADTAGEAATWRTRAAGLEEHGGDEGDGSPTGSGFPDMAQWHPSAQSDGSWGWEGHPTEYFGLTTEWRADVATGGREGQDAHTRVVRRHGGAQRGALGESASPSHVALGTQGVMASASATVSTEASGGSRLLVAEAAARAAAAAAASLQDEMNLESGLPVAHAGQIQASEARQIAREVLHAVLGGSEATGSWRGDIDEDGVRDHIYGTVLDHEGGVEGGESYDEASIDLNVDHDQGLDDCDELCYPASPFEHDAATLSGTVSSLDLQVGGRAYLNVPQALPLVGPALVIAEPYRVAALPARPGGPASRCLFARRARDIRASLELVEVHQTACASSDRALSRNGGSMEGASPVPGGAPPVGREGGGLRGLPQGLGGEGATASGKGPAKKPPSLQSGAAAAPAAGPVAAVPRKAKRRPTNFRRGEQLGGGPKAGVSLESHHSLSEKRAAGGAGARRPRVLSRGPLGQDNVLRGRAIGTGP